MVEVPRLEPKHLFERRQRRDAARLKAYNTLLEQIYHKIYTCSQLAGHPPDILFHVPPFIFGLPKMDMEDCIVYLVYQLREAKFQVQFTWPNLLHISWRHHESDYFRNENPIVRAMLPPPEPIQQRKQGGGRGESRGTANLRSAVGARVGAPDVLSSMEAAAGAATGPRVRFSEPNAVTVQRGPNMNGGQVYDPVAAALGAPQKKATEYTPPASFVQQLERPGPGRVSQNGLADLWSFQ
jgi:hypothetical protein